MFTKNLRTLITKCPVRRFSNDSKLISVTSDDKTGFAVLSLQRPPVNSLNLELLDTLLYTLSECSKNHNGLILTSKHDKAFCAGLDLQELLNPKPERFRQFWSKLQDVWLELYRYDFPLVALINGHAPAGGCLIALSADYRIMRSNCIIGLNEVLVGMAAPSWLMDSMKNTIGFRQSELALNMGRLFSTKEAFNIGLIDEIVDSTEEGMAKALTFLNNTKKISLKAASLSKSNVRQDTIDKMLQTRDQELNTMTEWVQTDYFQNTLKSYLDSMKKTK